MFSKCNYQPKGKYPYKDVKAHFTKCHVSLAVDAAGQSTRGSLGECNSVGQLTTSVAAKATSRLAETPSQAANEARAKGKTSTTPTSRSPSYAAVTASPSTRSTTSSTTARSKTVAKSAAPTTTTREARRFGEAAATRNSPRTATVNKPCVVSVEIVKLPIKSISKTGVQNATKPARAPSHTPQRTSPEAGGFTTIRRENKMRRGSTE
ncbi:PREDICTED: cell wall protein DAN4-like [Trachymyrmex cornetzi]|uniref:cell wall protein DAN4-like n=1 Tax=Trachymyrmex cornetzi TaxID=471704 RepID=UPI00084F081E|nr:PREDICTED: cell wall protein DAN4-like [Trachymyrmex cornetzi]